MARVEIEVLAHSNVMGLEAGQTYTIAPTETVEFYLRTGHLQCLTDLGPGVDEGE